VGTPYSLCYLLRVIIQLGIYFILNIETSTRCHQAHGPWKISQLPHAIILARHDVCNADMSTAGLGWAWKPSDTSIHIYCKVPWEHKYRLDHQKICEHFLIPLYQLLFCSPMPCMTDKAQAIVGRVGDWYLLEYGTYIRVYGATKAPHMLSKFVLHRLALQEIAY
jgi:hypothetical protein